MADHFYQGEDIALLIEMFEDKAMTIATTLCAMDVTILVYTRYNGPEIKASTVKSDGVINIERLSDTQLRAIIPASATTLLEPGTLTIEMMITDQKTGLKRVSVSANINIEPSKIGRV